MFSTTPHSLSNYKKGLYTLTLFLVLYLTCTDNAFLDTGFPAKIPHSKNSAFVNESREPKILLVSAFFPLKQSKHPQKDYADWLSRFIGSITTPIYFYTTPSFAAAILAQRGPHPIRVNTSFTSPFDIPPLQGLADAYTHLHSLDREAFRHSPELYAVWNAKPWLLDRALQQSIQEGDEYDFAFWNDAGSFRSEHHYSEWPDPKRVEDVWQAGLSRVKAAGDVKARKSDLLFFPVRGTFSRSRRYWREDDGPIDAEISEGSFFGGPPATVSWWSEVFYAHHDHYLHKGHFVGKDQTLINSLFLLFPSRIIGVWVFDPSTQTGLSQLSAISPGSCGSPWFYYQFFLASKKERQAMSDKWMKDLEDQVMWPFNSWNWWLKRRECKLTQAVCMWDMLYDAFGKDWNEKKHRD